VDLLVQIKLKEKDMDYSMDFDKRNVLTFKEAYKAWSKYKHKTVYGYFANTLPEIIKKVEDEAWVAVKADWSTEPPRDGLIFPYKVDCSEIIIPEDSHEHSYSYFYPITNKKFKVYHDGGYSCVEKGPDMVSILRASMHHIIKCVELPDGAIDICDICGSTNIKEGSGLEDSYKYYTHICSDCDNEWKV
jgi:hypothetical protein